MGSLPYTEKKSESSDDTLKKNICVFSKMICLMKPMAFFYMKIIARV